MVHACSRSAFGVSGVLHGDQLLAGGVCALEISLCSMNDGQMHAPAKIYPDAQGEHGV